MFSFITLLVGRLGVEAVAAHQIAMSVAGLTFMVGLALGAAASVQDRLQRRCGRPARRPSQRRRRHRRLALLCRCWRHWRSYFGRYWLAGLYTTDAVVFALARSSCCCSSRRSSCSTMPRPPVQERCSGYKDTRTPMLIGAVAYWAVGFSVGVVFGFGLLGMPDLGLHGFWAGMDCRSRRSRPCAGAPLSLAVGEAAGA